MFLQKRQFLALLLFLRGNRLQVLGGCNRGADSDDLMLSAQAFPCTSSGAAATIRQQTVFTIFFMALPP